MQTRQAFRCLVLGLIFTAAACTFLGVAPAMAKKVTLKFAHSEAVANIRHDVVLQFAKQVSDLSKGEITVEVFPAGVMGTHQSCQEQVAMGTLDFYPTTAGLVSVFDPNRTQELIELPYLFDSYAQAYAFMDTPFVSRFYEPLLIRGIRYLATWDNGFRHMTNSVRAINTPEDMKGLKIRVVQSEMSINIINALGGNAVPMSYSELYTALSQKVVDGQENPFMNIYASKFYEVQKYMSVTKHQYSTLPIIMSDKTWKKLDENQRKIIQKVALESAAYMRKKVGANEDSQRKAMEAAGMKVNDVKDLAAFRKTQEPVYEWAKKKWGAERVSAVMTEVEKYRKMYPAGSTYFGLSDKKK